MSGKRKSATEFNIKTVPRETEISSESASITGATAAIALPPQIAVPDEIKFDVLSFTFKSLPIKNPTPSVPKAIFDFAVDHAFFRNNQILQIHSANQRNFVV